MVKRKTKSTFDWKRNGIVRLALVEIQGASQLWSNILENIFFLYFGRRTYGKSGS